MVKVSIVENITNIKNREIVYIDSEMVKIVFGLVDTNTIDIWDIIILVVSENITEQGWEMVSVYIVKVRVANYTVMVEVVYRIVVEKTAHKAVKVKAANYIVKVINLYLIDEVTKENFHYLNI